MKADNPFTSKLYHHTLPVRDEMWESIEKRLPPKEAEKRFPFFWFLLFASTLISGALMFGIINKKANANTNANQSSSYTLSPAVQNITATTLGVNSEKATSTSSTSSTSSTTTNTSNISTESTSNTEQANSSSSRSGNTTSTNASKVSSSVSSSPSNKKAKTRSKAELKDATNAKTKANSKNVDIVQASQDALDAQQMSSSVDWTFTSVSRSTASTSLLPCAELEELGQPGTDVIGTRKFKPDPNCYKFSGIAGNYYFSIDAFAGPGFSPRSFTAVDSESSSYTLARETTESNQYAWSAGARLNLQLKRGLAFRLGLLYDQAGDVFDYTDTLATHSTTQVDSFFAADGTFLYSDTSRVLIFGTLVKKIHNTYRHLDVPLLVSYEIPLGRSSSLMINAGPVFNLSASYEGQILDPMLHPRTITRGSQNELYAYKTSLGISLYLGAGVVFPITNKISGLVEPRYLYRIKPVTIKSYPLEEHRHFAGVNLGLRYFLD